jgi:hypothetical protein
MKNLAVATAIFLVAGIGVPAGADPTISITQPGNTKAAATTPLTYVIVNSSRRQIMLATSGACGSLHRPMKPAARFSASCAVTDGKSTIALTNYPVKRNLCAAHITRQSGINYTTFDSSTTLCREQQSLNHIEIVFSPYG